MAINLGKKEEKQENVFTEDQVTQIVAEQRADAQKEALSNLTEQDELAIAQKVVSSKNRRFLNTESKTGCASEIINIDNKNAFEDKGKSVANLENWEIEKIKLYCKLYDHLMNIGMTSFAESIKREYDDIIKLSLSRGAKLLNSVMTESLLQKQTQELVDSKKK